MRKVNSTFFRGGALVELLSLRESDSHPNSLVMNHFSESDYQELADWLAHRSQGIFDIVELEGFLTAIVIGPNTLSPLLWVPKVWGGARSKFEDLAEMNSFTSLVMGYYNEIVSTFEQNPNQFQPTFYESDVDGERTMVVDEWCAGFLKGMRLDTSGWKPIKAARPDLLKPITLFATPAGWRELEAGGEAQMHSTWAPRIAMAVRDIYLFWLPYRAPAQAQEISGARLH